MACERMYMIVYISLLMYVFDTLAYLIQLEHVYVCQYMYYILAICLIAFVKIYMILLYIYVCTCTYNNTNNKYICEYV